MPMQCGLLLQRRECVPETLEDAMLRHIGRHAAEHGHFWDKTAEVLPEIFYNKYTRRWMPTFHQINQFRGSALYLSRAAAWLMEQANADGLWDWGPHSKHSIQRVPIIGKVVILPLKAFWGKEGEARTESPCLCFQGCPHLTSIPTSIQQDIILGPEGPTLA